MKSITLAFALAGSAALAVAAPAMAQTAPAPKPPVAAPAPTPPNPGPQAAPQTPPTPPGQQSAAGGQPAIPTPSGPPEGMIVETPDGFFLVRPGGAPPQHLDIEPRGPQMGQNARPGDEAMDGMDQDETPPPPPHPHHPPHPPAGPGAHFSIRTPNMDVDVKCPDNEPMKACADTVAALVDKLNVPAH